MSQETSHDESWRKNLSCSSTQAFALAWAGSLKSSLNVVSVLLNDVGDSSRLSDTEELDTFTSIEVSEEGLYSTSFDPTTFSVSEVISVPTQLFPLATTVRSTLAGVSVCCKHKLNPPLHQTPPRDTRVKVECNFAIKTLLASHRTNQEPTENKKRITPAVRSEYSLAN